MSHVDDGHIVLAMSGAVFLNPGGPPWSLIVFGVAIVGVVVGLAWIWRISRMGEDLNASFWRSHPRGGHGSRLPAFDPFDERPTWGWIVTRLEIIVALGSIVVAIAGPALLTRWERPLNEHLGLAVALWAIAITTALVGTLWILRIASRGPEHRSSWWRSSRDP